MSESIIDVNILSNTLEKNNIEPNQLNCYLFLMFFLERCQLVSNIINIINPDIENRFGLSIKYNLVNELDYDKIGRRIKDFKNDFDSDFLGELLKFIKTSINEKKVDLIKADTSPNKLNQVFNSFHTIKLLIYELECLGVEDSEIQEFMINNKLDNSLLRLKLDREIRMIDLFWEKKRDKSGVYMLLKNWYSF